MARQGKIARLPEKIREELNQRLLDGQLAPHVLPWLNGLPEVVALLDEDFEGLRVTDKNLSDWRLGGFEEWRKRRERLERTHELSRYSVKLAEASGGGLAEGAAAILSGQILELLEGVDALREGGADGAPAGIEAMAEAIEGLTLSVSRLRKGDQNAETLRLMRERLEQQARELKLAEDRFARETCQKFLEWYNDARAKAIAESPASNAEKIKLLRQTYFAEIDALEKSGAVKIPS